MISSTALLLFSAFQVSHISGVCSQSLNEPLPVGPADREKAMLIAAKEAEKLDAGQVARDFCTTLDIRPDIEDEGKNAVTFNRFLWNGTFDLFLDPDWPENEENDLYREIFNMQMSYLQEIFGDCLQFRVYPEGATEPKGDYVHVYKTDNCASEWIGRKGGKQYLTFFDDCGTSADFLHELLHALGLAHEHNRADRDEYVTVYWDHILPEGKSQFQKVDPKRFSSYDVPYDYRSRMHYTEYAFSKDFEPTILAKNGEYVGGTHRGNITEYDMLKLRRMYKCGD